MGDRLATPATQSAIHQRSARALRDVLPVVREHASIERKLQRARTCHSSMRMPESDHPPRCTMRRLRVRASSRRQRNLRDVRWLSPPPCPRLRQHSESMPCAPCNQQGRILLQARRTRQSRRSRACRGLRRLRRATPTDTRAGQRELRPRAGRRDQSSHRQSATRRCPAGSRAQRANQHEQVSRFVRELATAP